MKFYVRTFALLLGGMYAFPVCAAQVDCNAVLVNGTFSYSQFNQNSYYQQVVYSRFLSSTYESSKMDTSLGGRVPIGDLVMGGNYSKNDYDAKKKSIDDTKFSRLTSVNEAQTILFSGDGAVLKAWSSCMRESVGGLAVHFELRNATTVSLVIEYMSVGTKNSDKISNFTLTGVDISTVRDRSCLRRGRRIVEGAPCRTTITLPDAWTPLTFDVNADNSSAGGYVPPRIKLIEERGSVPVPAREETLFRLGRGYLPPKSYSLSPEDQSSGWVLDPRTAHGAVGVVWNHGSMNWCASPRVTTDLFTVSYTYEQNTETGGHSGWSTGCRMTVYVEKMRSRWVPDVTAASMPGFPSSPSSVPAGAVRSTSSI